MAFDVHPGTGVTVPVPGSANAAPRLKKPNGVTALAQAMQSVKPRETSADHDCIEIRPDGSGCLGALQCLDAHAHLLPFSVGPSCVGALPIRPPRGSLHANLPVECPSPRHLGKLREAPRLDLP